MAKLSIPVAYENATKQTVKAANGYGDEQSYTRTVRSIRKDVGGRIRGKTTIDGASVDVVKQGNGWIAE